MRITAGFIGERKECAREGAPLIAVAVLLLAGSASGDPPQGPTDPTSFFTAPTQDLEVVGLRQQLQKEHARYVHARTRVRQLARTLAHSSSVREAIDLACSVYGSCGTLWRRAQCETGGTFSSSSHNRSGASGLFQFLPSTWSTTPFAGFSVWSPYANALAAGWMEAHGRGGEWVCR
jgi:hypothetical protein